jgi:hypothetical protein
MRCWPSTVYGSIRTQSMASLPMNTLATEFIALLGDAKAGRANEAAIQASLSAVFSHWHLYRGRRRGVHCCASGWVVG